MIKSAVTIALVPSIDKGPWIYWHELESSMSKASRLGFDAIELFTEDAMSVDSEQLAQLLNTYHLNLAAVGTGAGKVIRGLTLTHSDPHVRQEAIYFIEQMMKFGASFGAPAIIGSMQGNLTPGIDPKQSMEWLREGLIQLNDTAGHLGTKLIYEPLNRYETNLINTISEAASFLQSNALIHTRLLADLFHMNIEETNLSSTLTEHFDQIGHVHFADSNRKPAGNGHTDFTPIAEALKASKYNGYVSAEAFPWPTPDKAAEQTIRAFNQHFR